MVARGKTKIFLPSLHVVCICFSTCPHLACTLLLVVACLVRFGHLPALDALHCAHGLSIIGGKGGAVVLSSMWHTLESRRVGMHDRVLTTEGLYTGVKLHGCLLGQYDQRT